VELLIKGGTVINADDSCMADVAVKDGKITVVGQNILPESGTKIVDASGLYVLPGAIDAHTHFELEFGEFSSADDFFTGTCAASCGGVTTVIDFITPEKGESLLTAFEKRNALAKTKVCIDYSFHMGLTDINDHTIKEMEAVLNAGIPSFKVFMTYAFRATDIELKRTLSRAKEINALIMVHAEEHEALEALKAKFIAKNKTDAWHHYLSRPESNETNAVIKVVDLAKSTGAALYIVHLASEGGLIAIESAQKEGYPIYAETCPQYLNFTCDIYKRPDGRNFVCSPPIKGQKSKDALWQGIIKGSINTVATDHCPFLSTEKDRGKLDFTKIPNGVMGVENMYPYILSKANEGYISFERVVELCCSSPAKIFGIADTKGAIKPRFDADIVLYDKSKNFTVTQKNMHSKIDYTIWEGTELKGYPISTYSRGKLIYKDGHFQGKQGHGKLLKRSLTPK
jgi:dihydropyrimidinase